MSKTLRCVPMDEQNAPRLPGLVSEEYQKLNLISILPSMVQSEGQLFSLLPLAANFGSEYFRGSLQLACSCGTLLEQSISNVPQTRITKNPLHELLSRLLQFCQRHNVHKLLHGLEQLYTRAQFQEFGLQFLHTKNI